MDRKYHSEESSKIMVGTHGVDLKKLTEGELIGLYLLGRISKPDLAMRLGLPRIQSEGMDEILWRQLVATTVELKKRELAMVELLTDDSAYVRDIKLKVGMSHKIYKNIKDVNIAFNLFQNMLLGMLTGEEGEPALPCDLLKVEVGEMYPKHNVSKNF